MGCGHAQPWTNSSHYKCQQGAQSSSGPREPPPSASSFLSQLLPASRLSPFIGRKFRFRRKKKIVLCDRSSQDRQLPKHGFSAPKAGKLCVTGSHKKVSLTLEKESFKLCAISFRAANARYNANDKPCTKWTILLQPSKTTQETVSKNHSYKIFRNVSCHHNAIVLIQRTQIVLIKMTDVQQLEIT